LVFWCGRLLFGRKGKELLKGKDCWRENNC
jgi:hypothetical protein